MVMLVELVGLAIVLAVNTAAAAVVTRLLRVRLDTTWGRAIYVSFFVPITLVVLTILLGSVLGPNLGDRATAFGLLVIAPMALGVSIDVLWMPAPDEVELPEPAEG